MKNETTNDIEQRVDYNEDELKTAIDNVPDPWQFSLHLTRNLQSSTDSNNDE
ncbi:MAG: hypothetical protein ACI8P9_005106 [Parasphingorhabdus sp.]|jgi:hypothetical protein